MAVFANDSIMDAALDHVQSNVSKLIVCAGQPATYADATTLSGSGGNKLGEIAFGSGDVTRANGDTSGRKNTYAQKTGIPIGGGLGAGLTWDHVALIDDTNSRLLVATPLSAAQTVAGGDTVTSNAFDQEIADAA